MGLEQCVQGYMETLSGPVGEKSWVLAVSGGPDSMALMEIFARWPAARAAGLTVAHVNHGLRAEAGAEAQFVEEQARLRGLSCVVAERDVPSLRQKGESLEACARRVRYAALETIRQDCGAEGILTAHQQEDVAETVLLHLLRGSGLTGLSGIRPVRGKILRPLLCVSRREIIDWLKAEKIPYCEDASNQDLYYTRNRIRHVLLPLLREQFNPQIVLALNRLAEMAAADDAALESCLDAVWPRLVCRMGEAETALDVSQLAQLPAGLQRRAIRRALGGSNGITAQTVQDVLRLMSKTGSEHWVPLPGGGICRKVYGELRFLPAPPPAIASFRQLFTGPGRIEIPEAGRSFYCELTERPVGLALDADKLPAKLLLRSRQPGDRFAPSRAGGTKKLKEWLIDRKIPRNERDKLVLLTDETGVIYAVLPLAAGKAAAPDAQTRRFLCWREIADP